MTLRKSRRRYSTSQALYNSGGYELYIVSDLWEVPEDAIIGRSLVSAEKIVRFISKGIDLANKGYDGLEVNYIEVPDNENVEDYAYEFFNSKV